MKDDPHLRPGSYGPERLGQIYRAFDSAWEAIVPLVEDNPLAHEAARLALANTILSVATNGGAERHGVGAGVVGTPEAPVREQTGLTEALVFLPGRSG